MGMLYYFFRRRGRTAQNAEGRRGPFDRGREDSSTTPGEMQKREREREKWGESDNNMDKKNIDFLLSFVGFISFSYFQ
jgi:hypothetical protein